MSPTSSPAVSASGLSVSFGSREALSDVSFELFAGSFVGVLGPNGAGKTTLLRALLGMIGYRGSVRLEGRPAYVPQGGATDADFPIDALGVVLMGRYPRLGWGRRPGARDRRRSLEILGQVGLADEARVSFGKLSGGQRQRALVGRALAQEGDVMLLDEPLTGVDAPSQAVLLDVFEAERRSGRTVLMTTHDLSQAARVCDRLLLLNRTLVADGRAHQVVRPEVLGRAYGGELLLVDGQRAVLDDAHHHDHHAP
jgi:manganese/iron transport system ATP-binding protein